MVLPRICIETKSQKPRIPDFQGCTTYKGSQFMYSMAVVEVGIVVGMSSNPAHMQSSFS